MRPLSKKAMVTILAIGLLQPGLLFAVNNENEFNPNYILSDEELQDWQSADQTDIQVFLVDNGGYLSRLRIEDKDGVRRTAADIIYRAAQEYKINPKYLLVKLQKEQSLVTDPNPSQKQLDGAAGYGITDGCGWSCDVYLRNKGFGKQVDSAAGIMRWYYDNVSNESFIKKTGELYTIDNTRVRPATLATAFLYTYTPHIEGNQNFWTLWQKWFEQIYPDGTLVKIADNPNVYLIQGGKKRLIKSMSALITRFDPKLILAIPSSELARYELGNSITLPNYSIIKSADNYYLLDYDTLRPFQNHEVVRQLGYHPDEIIEVTPSDLADYPSGAMITADTKAPLGRLVRAKENNSLYFIKNDTYYSIYDEKIARAALSLFAEEKVAIAELKDLTQGSPILFKDGTIIGIEGSNKIYVIENGEKRHIASEDVFNGLGYNWANIIWTNQFAGMAHKNGQAVYLNRNVQVAGANESNVEEETATEGKMIKTPEDSAVYTGPIFETDVDVYLAADYATGQALAGKNIDIVRPMASFAKVMTGFRLLTEGINLSRINTFSEAKHRAEYDRYRVVDGEMIRNRDLMDAMLVSSLNTPARMLAISVDTNENAFIGRMNSQALSWGLNKTMFTDVAGAGLSNKTTAGEFLTIFTQSMNNSNLKNYLAKKDYKYSEVLDKDGMPDHFDNNSNDLVNKSDLGFTILASKTAYLDEAGAGLAMLIQRPADEKKFVIITMGNPDYEHRFNEPEALAKWTLANF